MEISKKIRTLCQSFVKNNSLPGLAVSVIADGKIILKAGFGRRITPKTIFHLASIAKTVTATAVLQLMEKNEIRLSDKIVDHLPEFALDDKRARMISILALLAHTSGLPDVLDFEWTNPRFDDAALKEHVASLTEVKLRFSPGRKHAYSDIGYEVLGRLVEKVSGMPFEEYIQTKIFDPLGMNDSTFLIRRADQSLLARPHVGGQARLGTEIIPSHVFPYNRKHAPSSTFYSNAKDLTIWMRVQLDRGHPVISHSSHAIMAKTIRVPNAVFWTRRGHGLFAGTHRRRRFFGHEGSDNGFRASMLVIPSRGVGISLLCNYDGAPLKEMMSAIMDAV